MAENDKALVASSEFDIAPFVAGMDAMSASLQKFSALEEALQKQLTLSNKALADNKAAITANKAAIETLDKSSADYQAQLTSLTTQQQQLTTQQKDLQTGIKGTKAELTGVKQSTTDYKDALNNVVAVSRQVKESGRNLFDVASITQQVQKVTAAAGNFREIFNGKIPTEDLDALEEKLASTGDEFERLRTVIDFIEEKMQTLDPGTEGFADLQKVVETGRGVLEQFGQVQETVAKNSDSLRGRLSAVRNELAKMIADGVDPANEDFVKLQKEAAHLQDALDKAGERVRTFSNDFRLLEGGIEAIRGVAAGFELAEGASALFGVKNEAVEESIKRLNAIMAIANGLQEVSNLLKKESVIRLVAEEIATKAYTISQRILAVTLGTTAAASKGLAATLAATGIGALVIGIGLLISAIAEWSAATKAQTEAQENLNVAIEQGNRDNEIFIAGIEDATKILSAQAQVTQANNQLVGASDAKLLRQRIENAEALRVISQRGLEQEIDQARAFEASNEERRNAAQERLDEIVRTGEGTADDIEALNKTIDETSKAIDTRIELENKLELQLLINQRDRANERAELQKLELQRTNDFLKRLEELRKKLLDDQNKSARQDAQQLGKQAADQLAFQLKAIDRDVRKGQLTNSQGRILKDLLRQINDVELTQELKEFEKKSIEAQQSIEDQIFNLRLTAGEQRTSLLRDQLEREAATIEINFRKEFNALEIERTAMLQGVREAFDQGLISEGQFQANSDRIQSIYANLFLNLTELTRRKQEELANLAFQRSQELVQQLFAPSFTKLSEETTSEIQKVTARFTSGQITFEKYQKELTRITREESQKRIKLQQTEAEQLLAGVERRLALEQDPQRRDELQAEILRLREEIAQLKRQAAQGEAENTKANQDQFDAKVARIAQYAQAIGGLVEQVVGFWARANEAEQAQLDKSIAIQQKRVEAATRVAERGNAEYLRLEEDRLNDLQVKQEAAARRQLAINAILQASQALVAFTSALAQGIATGGPLGGIAIATAVLGLIASGYAIVQNLQNNNNTQQLKKGDKYVRRRNGEPSGDDTIAAMLTEGEAVIPKGTNQEYGDAVEAIYDRTVPAEDMNAFVNSYAGSRRRTPALNYEHIGEVTEMHTTYDARLVDMAKEQNRRLEETNQLLHGVNTTLKNIGVHFSIDRHGLIGMLLEGFNNAKITKRT